MKLCFIYNEKNDKYDKLAKEIYEYFKANKSKVKISNMLDKTNMLDKNKKVEGSNKEKQGAEDKELNVYKTKYDLYIFFSDSAQELKQNYENLKRPKKSMIITENLTVEYIMLCVDLAENICYSKKSISDICSRIETLYEKHMEN